MRDVDDVLARDAGEEVLVAPGDADDLVRQHRPDDEGDVVLDDGTVEQHRHVHRQPPLGELRQAGRRDRAEVGEGRRLPPLVVEHGHAGIGGLERALLVAEVGGEGGVRHRLVRAEGDERRHPA